MNSEGHDKRLPEPRGPGGPDVVAGGLAEWIERVLSVDGLAGPLTPALMIGWRVVRRADDQMWRQVSQAIYAAADQFDSPNELEHLATADPGRTELMRRVLQAAGRSTLDEKIVALGRVLASGLRDDAVVDDALFLAAALADLERPHVRVLAWLALRPDESEGLSLKAIDDAMPGYSAVLVPTLQTLQARGLILGGRVGISAGGNDLSLLHWKITAMGSKCLDLLRSVP